MPPPSFLSYMGPAVSLAGEETSGPGTGKTAEGKTKGNDDGKKLKQVFITSSLLY